MSEKPSILFMDDEPSNDIVLNALEALRAEGYDVDFVDTMSAAIDAYYQKFYAVFILDIDMSHLPDDQEGDGVKVLKRFISLHNQTRVILFSGAGTVEHWFAAANSHCFAYVAKDEQQDELNSIGLLVAKVREALAHADRKSPSRPLEVPRHALLVTDNEDLAQDATACVRDTLGTDWTIQRLALAEVDASHDFSGYGVLLVLAHEFSTRHAAKEALSVLLARAPAPQTIVGSEGRDQLRPSILFIANQRPFRMVNLSQGDWRGTLCQALRSACQWYGQREIFPADSEALERIQITLPEDVQGIWQEDISDEELAAIYESYDSDETDSKDGKE